MPERTSLLRFGDFTLDRDARELRQQGAVVPLSGRNFDLLVYLIEQRERVVSGEELFEAVWNQANPRNQCYDPQYNQQAITKIRQLLNNDDYKDPRYIRTVHGYGYRFIAPVIGDVGADLPAQPEPSDTVGTAGAVTLQRKNTSSGLWILLPWVAASIVIAGWIYHAQSASTRPPKVVDTVAITHDSAVKYAPTLTDGKRIYFTESRQGVYSIRSLVRDGGAQIQVPTSVVNPYLCDLSSDSGSILVRSVIGGFDDYGPVFIQRVAGGSAIALPVSAFDAVWSPDQKSIVFTRGPEVSRFDLVTQRTTRLTEVAGFCWWPRFSPDKKRIRITVTDGSTQATSIWEFPADGGAAHRMFAPQAPWGSARCGSWTHNGKYFIFQVGPPSASNIWALDESGGAGEEPAQLTFGPSFRGPSPSPDGREIFVRTSFARGEMYVFDNDGSAKPLFTGGILADMVSFSPNGQSIVYCLGDRERSLWMSSPDGSNSRRLTGQQPETTSPKWSPDGRFIAFAMRRPGQTPWKIAIVNSSSGGPPRELDTGESNAIHPKWSPDGKQILFGTIPTLEAVAYLHLLDVGSGRVSTVAGSDGLFAPALSPDGRFIAALTADTYALVTIDRLTGVRSVASPAKSGIPVWSQDGKSVYTVQPCGNGRCVFSVDPVSHKARKRIELGEFPLLDGWMGLDPRGALLLAKNLGYQEIMSLKVAPML